jgi:NADH-quinone oxidoreductase subunit E
MSRLSEDAREKIRSAARRYPDSRGAVLPALHIVQGEAGYVSEEAMRGIAAELNVPEPDVYGTATFYSLIRRKRAGRHVISLCRNLTCTLMGAEPVIEHLGKRLGVNEGEVSADGAFTFQQVECIGRCDGAPAMLVDNEYYGELTPGKIEGILERYRQQDVRSGKDQS